MVQNLLSCLDNPELPFLQWQECFAVLANRLPKELRQEVNAILIIFLNMFPVASCVLTCHSCLPSDLRILQLEAKYKEFEGIFSLQNVDFPARILRGVIEVGLLIKTGYSSKLT